MLTISLKECSLLIEKTLRKINTSAYGKSDEISLDPYNEIVLALENRVSAQKLEKFKLHYQGISGQKLQKLIDDNYDIEQLLKSLEELIEDN